MLILLCIVTSLLAISVGVSLALYQIYKHQEGWTIYWADKYQNLLDKVIELGGCSHE